MCECEHILITWLNLEIISGGNLGGKAALTAASRSRSMLVPAEVFPGQTRFVQVANPSDHSVVRRRSTVRFRKGAPGQRLAGVPNRRPLLLWGQMGGSFAVYRRPGPSSGEGMRFGSVSFRRSGECSATGERPVRHRWGAVPGAGSLSGVRLSRPGRIKHWHVRTCVRP
jgi:hypothetical protein